MATRTKANGKSPEVITVTNPATYPEFPDWFKPLAEPFSVTYELEFTTPYVFSRYDPDLIDGDGSGAKKRKTALPPETQITLNEAGEFSIPSSEVWYAVNEAGKNYKNPRASAGSLKTVLREGLVTTEELLSFGVKKWDFVDARRGNNSGRWVTKRRPALTEGHVISGGFRVTLPQYITPAVLNRVMIDAGLHYGIGQLRNCPPFWGRFMVRRFETV